MENNRELENRTKNRLLRTSKLQVNSTSFGSTQTTKIKEEAKAAVKIPTSIPIKEILEKNRPEVKEPMLSSMKINLIRPDDLLNLRVETVNLRLEKADPDHPMLIVNDTKQAAYLIFKFPPQTITEPAYFESSIVQPEADSQRPDPDAGSITEPIDPPGIIGTDRTATGKAANPSRLVFKVPADAKIPHSIQGLLDWSNFELQVNPIAAIDDNPTQDQINNAPPIQEPKQTETALELPYQLLISPTNKVIWNHRLKPFTSNGRTELWHTRLQLKKENEPIELSSKNRATLRAIWSNYPDYDPNQRPTDVFAPDPELGRTAMTTDDRWQIVILTSAFHGYETKVTINMHQPPITSTLIKTSQKTMATPNLTEKTDSKIQENSQYLIKQNYHLAAGKYTITVPYVPKPFYTEQLMLSALGGWLKSRGNWTPPKKINQPPPSSTPNFQDIIAVLQKNPFTIQPQTEKMMEAKKANETTMMDLQTAQQMVMMYIPPKDLTQLDLSEWIHIATQGRDHYVRIVYEGELWPFRHRAALIKVTERKFKETSGIVGAYLMQRMFIVVREPEKQFVEIGNPFNTVRLTTTVTPDIAEPQAIPNTTRSFWVEVVTNTSPHEMFQFHAVAKDWSGNWVDFTIPLMFVSISDLPDAAPDKTKLVVQAYNDKNKTQNRNARLFGNKVTFAPQDDDPTKRNSNTTLVTEILNFVVDQAGNPAKMLFATVKIPQIQDILGKDTATTIRYFEKYAKSGFDAVNGVFAQIISENLSATFDPEKPFEGLDPKTFGLDFTSDKAGGFATPNMNISTLTRKLGPIAGKVEDALTDTFDPSKFFEGVAAQLFGAFDLIDLLLPTKLGMNAPQLKTKTEDSGNGKLIKATLDWEPEVKGVPLGVAEFINHGKNGKQSKLAVHGLIQKTVDLDNVSSPPTFEFNGNLTDFIVTILDSVSVNFTEFSFTANSGKKPDVNVKLDPATPIEFMGDLKFVEELRKAIPPNLFGSGPSLDISPTGIRAGFAFTLPPITVGVFSLKDVSLGAALTLPFLDGKPTLDFNISEREHPFLLTVYFFAGSGFFRLQLDTLGMKELEAALEFGAAAALDIGVASGEVHIMAGIYFSLQREEDAVKYTATLTGYMRLGGSLNVLGIIHLSVEFNLSFTYDSSRDKAYGRATLTVEVEVLFFSASVELTVERGFGGSGDPHFAELFTKPQMWSDYALAFA